MKSANNKNENQRFLDRLARAEGQIRGVSRMISDDDLPMDILTQIQAARSALAAIGRELLRNYLVTVVGRNGKRTQKEIDETIRVVRLLTD